MSHYISTNIESYMGIYDMKEYNGEIVESYNWYHNGELHRNDDKPAVICVNFYQEWYQHGKLHRDYDKPAFIGADGTLKWYINGKHHLIYDNPTCIVSEGNLFWYQNGKHHRDKMPPAAGV